MPAVHAKARILFPRSCFNKLLEPYNTVKDIHSRDGRLVVDVWEKLGTDAGVTYELDQELRVRSAAIGDRFTAYHRELRVMGRLDHDLAEREMRDFEKVLAIRKGASPPQERLPLRASEGSASATRAGSPARRRP